MSNRKGLLAGVTMNWLALGTGMAVAFFLSPFVVRHLGSTGYGVWTLVQSMISYMGLLDLGLRGAVTRFISGAHAQGDHTESSKILSAAFWLRSRISFAVLLLTLLLANRASHLFHIPSVLQEPAQWAILATGTSFALTLTFGVFGGVLAGLHRFDLLSGITIMQTVIRASGVIWLLRAGYGIRSLAVWELILAVLVNLSVTSMAFRIYPQLQLIMERPARQVLSNLWNYSFYAFLINTAAQVVYYSDNLVVGAFLSAQAVAFYAIGGSLIEYLRQLVSSLTVTFTPLASSFEAQGQRDQLRKMLIHGTRGAMFIALPIGLALFFRGPTFIGLWMGLQFGPVSGRVLQILLLGQIFALANNTSGGIVYGLGKHRRIAFWAGGEAVANLALSIVLVRVMGIQGVAWGTIIPSVFIHVILWPRFVCGLLEMRVRDYLWSTWILSGLCAIPYALACYLTQRYWPAKNLLHFFVQIATILPVFILCFALCFWKDFANELRYQTRRLTKRLSSGEDLPLSAPQSGGPG